jgi:hypothetical protein
VFVWVLLPGARGNESVKLTSELFIYSLQPAFNDLH